MAKRGYYSEHTHYLHRNVPEDTEIHPISPKKRQIAWQVKKRRHIGDLNRLTILESKNVLSPAEKWIMYGEDNEILFPLETEKPEVYREKELPAKSLPRNVLIERKRREYKSLPLEEIMDEQRIKALEILPPEELHKYLTSYQKYSIGHDFNVLPLELFDNEDYECMTVEKWLHKSTVKDIKHTLPASAYIPTQIIRDYGNKSIRNIDSNNLYKWTSVAVGDFNPETKKWAVITLDKDKFIYYLPRIYILFKAENPKIFASRLRYSIDYRDSIQLELKFQLYVDCMNLAGVEPLDEIFVSRIAKLTTRKNVSFKEKQSHRRMLEDLQLDYRRTLAEVELRQTGFSKYNLEIQVPLIDRFVLGFRCIETHMEHFPIRKNYMHWMGLFVIPHTFNGLYNVATENEKLNSYSLFMTHFRLGVSLAEFLALQSDNQGKTMRYLKDVWIPRTVSSIKASLVNIGKTWFNIHEKKWEIYEVSKLSRYVDLLRYQMQETLHNLIMRSVNAYVSLLTDPCEPTLACPKFTKWGANLIESPYVSKYPFVFTLYLHMNENEAYYSTKLEDFASTLVETFNNIIRETHTIKQIQPFLLENLKFADDLYLTSIGLMEPEIKILRHRLAHSYQQAMLALRAYSLQYKKFLEIYNINIPEYVEIIRQQEREAKEMKAEIFRHIQAKEMVDNTIPVNIIIGPFLIITYNLKILLLTKTLDIALSLLDMYAKTCRARIDDIIDKYETIFSKLVEKVLSIEQIFEIRAFIKDIPELVEDLDKSTRQICADYEVLDYFYYSVTDADFNARWHALSYPVAIFKEEKLTDAALVDESDRFFRIHLNDEISHLEKIESLGAQVGAMALIFDTTKIHETAVDCRKLWKNIKEAQSYGELLNRRQQLFEITYTPYTEIEDLLIAFQPVRDVWGTASDTLKARDIWMENPLQTLDSNVLHRVINETLAILDELYDSFEHSPKMQSVIIYVRDIVQSFKPYIKLVKALRNSDMKDEHWKQISEVSKIHVEMFPVITLEQCLNMGIDEHVQDIVEISEEATREYLLVEALRMKASNEKFMRGLVEQEIIMDIRNLYNRSIEEYMVTIIEEMLVEWDKNVFIRDILKKTVANARNIGYENVSISMRILIEEHMLSKIPYNKK